MGHFISTWRKVHHYTQEDLFWQDLQALRDRKITIINSSLIPKQYIHSNIINTEANGTTKASKLGPPRWALNKKNLTPDILLLSSIELFCLDGWSITQESDAGCPEWSRILLSSKVWMVHHSDKQWVHCSVFEAETTCNARISSGRFQVTLRISSHSHRQKIRTWTSKSTNGKS